MILRVALALAILATPAYSQSIYITPSKVGTAATGQIPGTTTNDSASAGNVGELVQSSVLVGSAVSLTTNTPAQITTISLTAGDWTIFGAICFNPAATTSVTQLTGATATTTANIPAGALTNQGLFRLQLAAEVPTNIPECYAIPTVNASPSSTTSYFLNANAVFTVSTMSAYGTIAARRAR